jgi:hypothetical protein
MIAARIDRLAPREKALLQRAAVAGRTFPAGAVAALLDDSEVAGGLDELVRREFLVREPRSAIRGEEAYRFKHGLIRDVAYASLPKSSRGSFHRRLAAWIADRVSGDELVEIRAYHLDEAADRCELEGARPAELASDAAAALERADAGPRTRGEPRRPPAAAAGGRARADARAPLPGGPRRLAHDRHAGRSARWRPCELAREAGDNRPGQGADGLAQVALYRDTDHVRARELANAALE